MRFCSFRTAGSVFALLLHACIVAANIDIHNWCPFDVYAYQEIHNDCPRGGPPGYLCYIYQKVEFPYVFSSNSVTVFPRLTVPSVNIKMSKVKDIEDGIFQFEYTLSNTNLFWDISDTDGTGDGIVGNIFADQNVKVTPVGDLGSGNCHQVTCAEGKPCTGAYQQSDDNIDTQGCPLDVGDIWIDLCEPDASF